MHLWSPMLLLVLTTAFAPRVLAEGPEGVFVLQAPFEAAEAYDRVYRALEAEEFWVVFEANMGDRMARFAERWGADYNRNELGGIKAMVFCNMEWTNHIANADPLLLGLCPLHLTVYERRGETFIVFPRPSYIARGSPGATRAAELEAVLRGILEKALEP